MWQNLAQLQLFWALITVSHNWERVISVQGVLKEKSWVYDPGLKVPFILVVVLGVMHSAPWERSLMVCLSRKLWRSLSVQSEWSVDTMVWKEQR